MRQLPCTHYPGWAGWLMPAWWRRWWCGLRAENIIHLSRDYILIPILYRTHLPLCLCLCNVAAAASNNKPESINVGSRHDIPCTRYPPPPPIPVPRNSPWERRVAATWANHTGHTTIYYLIYFAGGVDYCCCYIQCSFAQAIFLFNHLPGSVSTVRFFCCCCCCCFGRSVSCTSLCGLIGVFCSLLCVCC